MLPFFLNQNGVKNSFVQEIGGMIEYYCLKNKFSYEAGGGANPNGFTIRTGVRAYRKNGFYFNYVFFYRYNYYHNRQYEWRLDERLGVILETKPDFFHSGADTWYVQIADETKQVFCFQVLFGKQKIYYTRILFDLYVGVGFRYKYRVKEISYYSQNGSGIFYSPPQEEIVNTFLPSIQAGFRFGYAFRLKKKK